MNKKIFLIISFVLILFIGQFYNKAEAISLELIETKAKTKIIYPRVRYQEKGEYKLKNELLNSMEASIIQVTLYQNEKILWTKRSKGYAYLTKTGKVLLHIYRSGFGKKTVKIIDKEENVIKEIDRGNSYAPIKFIGDKILISYKRAEKQGLIMLDSNGKEIWNKPIEVYGTNIWIDPDTNYLFIRGEGKENIYPIYQYDLNGELIFKYEINHHHAAVEDFYDSLVIIKADPPSLKVYNYTTGQKLLDYTANPTDFHTDKVAINCPKFIGKKIGMMITKGWFEIPGKRRSFRFKDYLRIINLKGNILLDKFRPEYEGGISIIKTKGNIIEIRGDKIYVYKINE